MIAEGDRIVLRSAVCRRKWPLPLELVDSTPPILLDLRDHGLPAEVVSAPAGVQQSVLVSGVVRYLEIPDRWRRYEDGVYCAPAPAPDGVYRFWYLSEVEINGIRYERFLQNGVWPPEVNPEQEWEIRLPERKL